eukprot:NODE_4802_length_738_cov_82.101473_g4640_i0.p1 GENE.NODE_4802_length_738_cov_82.101473_g4640_i0~~NODE_4802_length_738_cov_82.101473_g4640_i0.p1  ORF type:complete len:188 (+),score=54.83 NODE_4802_length_738_cov_82.101473_g4640_i0:52-615(+)
MSLKFLGMLPLILLIREIDFNNPTNLIVLRIVFFVVQSALLLVMANLYTRVRKAVDHTPLEVPPQPKFGAPVDEDQGPEFTTVTNYDISQLRQLLLKLGMGMGITSVLHFYWHFNPPMLMQCVVNPMQLFSSPLFKLYFLGHLPVGALERPWVEENPLKDWLMGKQADTVKPKKRVKETKKSKKARA